LSGELSLIGYNTSGNESRNIFLNAETALIKIIIVTYIVVIGAGVGTRVCSSQSDWRPMERRATDLSSVLPGIGIHAMVREWKET
jgi:hypothetical protein